MPGAAVFGTVKMPVVVSNVPTVGATLCVMVTFVVSAVVVTLAWSLLKTFSVQAVPNGVVALSLTASMMLTLALLALFSAFAAVSLVALVVPATVTAVATTLLSTGLAGSVTLSVQVSVAPAGKAAAVPLLAAQAVTVTVAPAIGVVAVQVASVAVAPASALVQVKTPVTVAPGAPVTGNPVIALVMSAPAPTVMLAIAVSQVAVGVVAGTVQIR